MKYGTLILLILLMSCADQKDQHIPTKQIKTSIEDVMHAQADAWTNGDIDSFMEGYWKSDSLRFVGSKSITYGWNQTKANYKRAYPTREAMGSLSFDIKEIDVLSHDAALLLGGFTLYRVQDTLSGNFTLVWKNINGKWLITSDMTCG